MANFNLYINRMEENIHDYRKYKKKCLDNIEYSYNVLSNIDGSWVDHNTDVFLKKLEKDKKNVKKYFSYLDKLYNQIEIFKDNIVSILNRYGCNGRINSLSFDNGRCRTCVNYIENSIYYIDQSIKKILSIIYPSDFSELDLVNEILRNLYDLNNDLHNCKNDISNLSSSISNEISNSRSRVSRIETFNYKFDISSYNWSNVELDINSSRFEVAEEKEEHASSKEIKSQNDMIISGLGDNVFKHDADDVNIDETKKIVVEGLHDDFDEEYATQRHLNESVQEAPSGLNNNVNLERANSNEVKEELLDKIEGLDNEIKSGNAEKKSLDIETQDEISGLSNNIEDKKANSVDFNIKDQELEIGKVDEYNNKENSIELSKNFDSAGNLSVNVFDNNSKSLNMESNSSYNVSDGIKSVGDITGARVNVDSTNNYDLSSNITKMTELDLNNK